MPKTVTQVTADEEAAEGYCFICVGPFCWGRGTTPKAAKRNARKEASTDRSQKLTFKLYLVPDPEAYVDDMGRLCWKDPQQIGYTEVEVSRG